MASQWATDRGYSSKIMKGDEERTATGYQVLSAHKICSSLTSDAADHTKDSVGSSISSFYSSNETEAVIRCESNSVEVNHALVNEIEKHAISIEVCNLVLLLSTYFRFIFHFE